MKDTGRSIKATPGRGRSLLLKLKDAGTARVTGSPLAAFDGGAGWISSNKLVPAYVNGDEYARVSL